MEVRCFQPVEKQGLQIKLQHQTFKSLPDDF